MTHATADRHANRIADHLGAPLPVVLDNPEERAMLVMLLYAMGYNESKIRSVLHPAIPVMADHRLPAELDRALHIWRTEDHRKLQYRHILDTLLNEDKERAKATSRGRASGAAGFGEEGGKPLGVDSRERGASAVRGGRAKAARNQATHQSIAPAH